MTIYPKPTIEQMRVAFRRSLVPFVEVEGCTTRCRPWDQGLRAAVNHHTVGENSLTWILNKDGRYPFANCLIAKDGRAYITAWGSAWGSGEGGPWKGVAAVDSLHLVGWQSEVESLGRERDFTQMQLETLSRINAALVWLGMPPENEINHKDWADATNGVTGPLPIRRNGRTTAGRKVDTLYDIEWLRINTRRRENVVPKPPVVPPTPPSPSVDGSVSLKNLSPGKKNSDVTEYQNALRKFLARSAAKLNPSGATGFYGDETRAMTKAAYSKLAVTEKNKNWLRGDLTVPGAALIKQLGLKVKP